MSAEPPERLIQRHEAFLARRPTDRPLLGCWIGGYYPAEQFPRGTAAWKAGQPLRPADVSFAPFAEDYQNLYRLHREANDDFFYVASAYWGIPWLEAILGCPVSVAPTNCRAETCLRNLGDTKTLQGAIGSNPWLELLLRFTRELVEFSAGRFPVCPPLLRGPGDAACAMLGGMPFIMGFLDEPEKMRKLLSHCAQTRLAVLRRLQAVIPAWHGTYAAGGYPSRLWCRRTVAYHQEDSAALLSPPLFKEFLLSLQRPMSHTADVNFIHLHSACLYPVDMLLKEGGYDVLQINIDHEGAGPRVRELLKTFQRIQAAGKPLLLWGEFSPEAWELLRAELSPVGLSLQPIVKNPGRSVFSWS